MISMASAKYNTCSGCKSLVTFYKILQLKKITVNSEFIVISLTVVTGFYFGFTVDENGMIVDE